MTQSQAYDLNDAQPNTFEVIPDGTQVPIILKFITGEAPDDLHPTKDGRARMVKLEAQVTDGPYARRKFFLNLLLQSSDLMDEGHKKAIDISKSTLRAIVEAARGFSPTDETPAAVAARRLGSITDLHNMELTVIVGVEKGFGTYTNKNVLKRVVPHGKAAANGGQYDAGKEATSMRAAGQGAPSYAAAKSGAVSAPSTPSAAKKW